MSYEIPGCNEAKQCIDCKYSDGCIEFDDLKKMVGGEILYTLRKYGMTED